ncbi:MAG: methyltetrahydrofolate--corrinoid methyltransferase, partial [Candidatus Hydrogenedentes bacterium]|nr:methyltetrahydrofolate--corrinoid methyltransferase [Candidatus Hydrogenedentota bacterium]
NVAPKQAQNVIATLQQLKMLSDPPPHLNIGLSNLSQNCNHRPLINRTYLVMALAAGLDAAILDPLDKELMDAIITTELLMEKVIYCDSFLDAHRLQV